jgi:hypothetical protein
MKFEVVGKGTLLWKEECPICELKHFLKFIKYRTTSEYESTIEISEQKNAHYIQYGMCKTLFEIPKELRK